MDKKVSKKARDSTISELSYIPLLIIGEYYQKFSYFVKDFLTVFRFGKNIENKV